MPRSRTAAASYLFSTRKPDIVGWRQQGKGGLPRRWFESTALFQVLFSLGRRARLAMVAAVQQNKRIFQAGSQRVSNIVYKKAAEIAEARHVSVDEIFASAFAEHVAEWERLQQRALRGSREKFLAVLDKVPDVEPEEFDRI